MWYPQRPNDLESAKVSNHFIQEAILKILFLQGSTRGIRFCEVLHLPYALIDSTLKELRTRDLLAPIGGTGVGGYEGMEFALTPAGVELAQVVNRRSPYVGPAPVDISDYMESVKIQKLQPRGIQKAHLKAAFSDVVLNEDLLEQVGPALNSGGPIFLYGKPGNGKTVLSERLAKVFRQGMFVPHAIQIDGQIIQVYDEKVHRKIPLDRLPEQHPLRALPLSLDPRWVYVYRPFIIVGGELTLEMLDLSYREGQACYEAPFQLKANGGVLLVDDFGRQIVKPKEFLNRWIFPLEKKLDFLTLINGKKIEVPFELVLIFSTNLDPKDLADEAFWRRIKYKIGIPSPTEGEYRQIFEAMCGKLNLKFDPLVYKHLIDTHYMKANRELRAVHPRDILNHVVDLIAYGGMEMKLTRDLIDKAVIPYFTEALTHHQKPWSNVA